MPFWTYILRCADGTFYVGHSDDLERRVWQHQSGATKGYTLERLPVALVWSQEFASREEAKDAERQLKGWGQAKKLALIRGDWDRISVLAKKKGASTSPAKSGLGGGLSQRWANLSENPLFLHPHLAARPAHSYSLEVTAARRENELGVRFRLTGDLSTVIIPAERPSARCDKLWETTCFEAFVAFGPSAAYREFNVSPSTEWAIYDFETYRAGIHNAVPEISSLNIVQNDFAFMLDVTIPLPDEARRVGLSAVIEETDGTKSYWALQHPPGKPDFHHADCFALTLPAPGRP